MAAPAPAPVPAPASQGQVTRLASSDGAELSLRDWPVDGGQARATVCRVTGSVWANTDWTSLPASGVASQTRMLLSTPAAANCVPSGDQATA